MDNIEEQKQNSKKLAAKLPSRNLLGAQLNSIVQPKIDVNFIQCQSSTKNFGNAGERTAKYRILTVQQKKCWHKLT